MLLLLACQCHSTLVAEQHRHTSLGNKLAVKQQDLTLGLLRLLLRTCRDSKRLRSSRNRCPAKEGTALLSRGNNSSQRPHKCHGPVSCIPHCTHTSMEGIQVQETACNSTPFHPRSKSTRRPRKCH